MKHPGKTAPFRNPHGETLPHSIAEAGYLRLGGADQWVMIRGENAANPVLVLLHGGPGFSEMRLFRQFNAPLEKHFTVVYWDQRGAGKSFDRRIPASSLTVEQFIADLDELVDTLCRRFNMDKVALYGHSWGSALGVLYAARFPQKVSVYAGTGQIGDWPASELSSYAFTVAEAARRRHRRALKQLRAIGPPPHGYSQMAVQRKWLVRFVGVARGMSWWRFFRIMLGGPESSIFDLPNFLRSWAFSPKAMWAEVSALNLVEAVPELRVPVLFLIGRHDHVVAADTSLAYFKALNAPYKQFIWFEESAHEPPVEEPGHFNRAMVELVRPIAAHGTPPTEDACALFRTWRNGRRDRAEPLANAAPLR